jgi:hypothetical protein
MSPPCGPVECGESIQTQHVEEASSNFFLDFTVKRRVERRGLQEK